MGDVENSSTCSSSSSDSGSESDRSHDDESSNGNSGINGPALTLSEATRQFYYATSKSEDDNDPVMKPSFLRNSRKNMRHDSGLYDGVTSMASTVTVVSISRLFDSSCRSRSFESTVVATGRRVRSYDGIAAI